MNNVKAVSKRKTVSMMMVRSYLDQNYAQDISLEALADKFGCNKFYLCHRFSDEFGYTLAQYLIQVRIKHACTLLEATRIPVAEIAHKVGFPSDTAFITRFKQETGITPHKYRILQRIQ